MLVVLIISLMANAALISAVFFLAYLTKQMSTVVRQMPDASVRESPAAVQASVAVATSVTGADAEAERMQEIELRRELEQAVLTLREEFGIEI